MRKTAFAVLILLFTACSSGPTQAMERFHDFGSSSDYDSTQDIYIPPNPANYWFWGMSDPKTFIFYETPTQFYWVTKPLAPKEYTSARVLSHFHTGVFRVRAMPGAADAVLAIRYKDNLLSPVGIYTKGTIGEKSIGQLGGRFDHKWKTAVLSVKASSISASGGFYEFRIAKSDNGELRGPLAIDWIKMATGTSYNAEPDAPGFWPKQPPSKFADAARTMTYQTGGKPKFVAGVMVKGMRKGSWQEFAAAGVNHIDLQSWEFNWGSNWELYIDKKWADRARFGFVNWLENCAKAGVGCSAQFFTDTRAYWIEHQYKSENEVLNKIESVVRANKGKPGLGVWYPKDEPDHDDPTWGAPPEFVMQLAERVRKADPDTAIFINFQAWKPQVYDIYKEGFDAAAFDVYPLGANRSVTEIGDRLDDLRRQVGDTKARWAIVEAHDGEHVKQYKRQLTRAETLVQGYLSIAHGAHGVIYFIDNEGAYIDMTEMPEPWMGIKQFCTEITGAGGIESYLVPPSEIADIMGEKGRASVSDKHLHFSLHKRADKTYALIVVNTTTKSITGARMSVKGLRAGTDVKVEFENRNLTASDGGFTDSVEPFGRKVYTFKMGN